MLKEKGNQSEDRLPHVSVGLNRVMTVDLLTDSAAVQGESSAMRSNLNANDVLLVAGHAYMTLERAVAGQIRRFVLKPRTLAGGFIIPY